MTDERRATGTRPRGRPRRDSELAPLDRAAIARAALEIAADQGFTALTMRTLAARLGVTVRALYNHVRDRQDVIDLVADRIMALQPEHRLDPEDWQAGVRGLYDDARAAYRTMGRAVLFSLEETVTPTEVPLERIVQPERLLAFLTDIGLDLEEAIAWRARFLTDVFGYTLLIDYRADRASATERRAMQEPVPGPWLAAHPEVEAPHSRRATTLPDVTSDELFAQVVDRAIADVERLVGGA